MEEYLKKIDLIKNNNNFSIPIEKYRDESYCKERRAILLLLASIMQKNSKFKEKSRDEQDDIILSIELSCYNETIKKSNELLIYINWENSKFSYLYQLYCNKITKNLDCESEVNSDYLINKVIDGEICYKTIANLSSDKLCPIKSVNIKQNLNLRNQQKLNYKTSTLYTCKNCKKKEVIIKQVQIRALDEGQSCGCTCVFCGYHWVVG